MGEAVRIEPAAAGDLAKLAQVERAANRLFLERGVTGVTADDVTPLSEFSRGVGGGPAVGRAHR